MSGEPKPEEEAARSDAPWEPPAEDDGSDTPKVLTGFRNFNEPARRRNERAGRIVGAVLRWIFSPRDDR